MRIIAVVVTYNRRPLLEKCIARLQEEQLLEGIVVVDNGSTDGTSEWLHNQHAITVLRQSNTGGAGGFHTGILKAFEMGADWIWCMDDDVYPDPDCLAQLLKYANVPDIGILCPRRIQTGRVFTNECQKINLSNPFTSLHKGRLKGTEEKPVDIEGMVFEGPLINRRTTELVGLPNASLFIFYDDTDYSYRTTLQGLRVLYIPDAIMRKEKFFTHDSWAEKQLKKQWKRLYHVRNMTYFNHHYGKNFAVRYLRPLFTLFGYLLSSLILMISQRQKQWRFMRQLCRAFSDGISEQLGIYSV
ncbi:MAG: glycosyltransferase family 2 protein [Bacteroidaceae bacterium]|nr:glycosyltransferase family 2 protein [Bacteroidaceae bacterium]